MEPLRCWFNSFYQFNFYIFTDIKGMGKSYIKAFWTHYDEIMTLGVKVHMYMCGIVPREGKRDDWTIDNSFCWAMHFWTGSPSAIKQQIIVLSGKTACLQHFLNVIFHWYFQNYSVKILYAIIDWEYLEILKWWIMGYSLSCSIEINYRYICYCSQLTLYWLSKQ